MRSLCPMTAMRLNNSHTAEMMLASEEMRIKSLVRSPLCSVACALPSRASLVFVVCSVLASTERQPSASRVLQTKPKPIKFKPEDLELFKTAVEVRWKGYDKITTHNAHGTLPAWKVKPETINKLKRGF